MRSARRRERLRPTQIRAPLARTAEAIEAALTGDAPAAVGGSGRPGAQEGPVALPDPFENDRSPWVLRRLDLASGLAGLLRADAQEALRPAARPD